MNTDIRKHMNLIEKTSPQQSWENTPGWNELPEQIRQKLLQAYPQVIDLADAMTDGRGEHMKIAGNDSFVSLKIGKESPVIDSMRRSWIFKDNAMYLADLHLDPENYQQNIAKRILKGTFDVCQNLEINSMDLAAVSMGAYVWARAGFLPPVRDLANIKNKFLQKMDSPEGIWYPESVLPFVGIDMPAAERAKVLKLLDSGDPKAVWKISDMKIIGKQVLAGVNWQGKFDMNNREQCERLIEYCKA